jgi:hypothetical protein
VLAKSASDLGVFFDQLDLLVVYVLDEGRQASEGLFATTSHSHQQGGRSRLSYYADYLLGSRFKSFMHSYERFFGNSMSLIAS